MVLVQKEALREALREVRKAVVRVSNTTFTPFCEVINIGTINILSKEKADTLLSMGFKYTEQRINPEQVVYSFIDTPEIRKIVSCQFAKNEFYISKTVCL